MNFSDKLKRSISDNASLLCVGIDPQAGIDAYDFSRNVVDATRGLACAYKPQVAHYASSRSERKLEHTISYIKETCPGVPIILDAKRGDI